MPDLYQQAVVLVIRTQECGLAHIATSLGCFYIDAARMLCRMEQEGIVSAIRAPGCTRLVLKKEHSNDYNS